MALSIKLTILMGPMVALPVPPTFMEALRSVEVTQTDEGRSGFQIKLLLARSGATGTLDYPMLLAQEINPFRRVVVLVTVGVLPAVLIDGVITHQQLKPTSGSQSAEVILTGEDLSVLMDLREYSKPFPAMDTQMIVETILATYLEYGIIPEVIPARDLPPDPLEWIPVQHGTDLDYISSLAAQCGYVFYLQPGPEPMMNTAYFGPPKRVDFPQPALSVNLGEETNVESIQFTYDALAPTTVMGELLDFDTTAPLPIEALISTRLPPMALEPALEVNQPNVRLQLSRHTGQSEMAAESLAQATVDRANDRVITAEGELNVLRYGSALQARGIVGVRGAGDSYDGMYYVKKVTHVIQNGSYRQKFTLTREGLGALTPIVRT